MVHQVASVPEEKKGETSLPVQFCDIVAECVLMNYFLLGSDCGTVYSQVASVVV